MKKNGFTLAEVLITLAIIGVVATLTLPALMTNTQEQQAKTALKKGINTLTEAAQMHQAIAGVDYSSISSDKTANSGEDEASLYRLLADRASINLRESKSSITDMGSVNSKDNFVVFFRDGSALSFKPADTLYTAKTTGGEGNEKKVGTIQSDGLPYGYAALYDTNGRKGPNTLSNCNGNIAATNDTSNIDACDNKSKRLIKDQFGVRLRGSYAVPNGAAARWAFSN